MVFSLDRIFSYYTDILGRNEMVLINSMLSHFSYLYLFIICTPLVIIIAIGASGRHRGSAL